jgi:hypothetical protein
MSVLGPAEFGARVQEQRNKLAALAKTADRGKAVGHVAVR